MTLLRLRRSRSPLVGAATVSRRRLALWGPRALSTSGAAGSGSGSSDDSKDHGARPPYRVLFFGTDDVSVATLRRLYENSQEPESARRLVGEIHVICPSDRKVGGRARRTDPVPVKRFALDHGLAVTHTPPELKSLRRWTPEILTPTSAESGAGTFDVGVVVSFGYFLHPHLLAPLRLGAINMHPSLLPLYRGPAPIHHALLGGDLVTGVSVIEIDPRAFDVGRILHQRELPIPADVTFGALAERLAAAGADAVLETLATLPERKAHARSQDDARASHAPKIRTQDGFLSLDETADELFHKWQALGDNVGISVRYQGRDVKLIEIRRPTPDELQRVQDEEQRLAVESNGGPWPAGSFFFEKKLNALWLKCADGSWLLVTKLQQADRKVGGALDFANGYRLKRSLQRFEAIEAATSESE